MARKKGTVTKAGQGKFSYFLQLDGNDFYYNTKFEPKCGEGDVVGIEYEPKGDSRGQIKNVKILEDNSGGYKKANSEQSSGDWKGDSSGGGKAAGGGDRQDSIIWQHSQEMAIHFADVLLEKEAFAIKGKPDEKRIQITGLVDELTTKFFNDASDPRKSEAFTTNSEIDEDASGSEEEDDEWSDAESEEW